MRTKQRCGSGDAEAEAKKEAIGEKYGNKEAEAEVLKIRGFFRFHSLQLRQFLYDQFLSCNANL